MNVVCFTLADANVSADEIRTFLEAVRDDGRAFFTPTLYKGTNAIRAAVSNWLTEERDIEMAYHALNDVYQTLYNRKPDLTVLS
jgi:hypothetical protein